MSFMRIVTRRLPDGRIAKVWPFHVSLEGMECVVLCRNDCDYDAMIKTIFVSARRKNVIVIIYAVVSNHCHVAILARSQNDADSFAQEIKRMYSMYFSRKYGERNSMQKVDVKAIYLDTDWYVRNALAYIPRNALDNGCDVTNYKWSGYSAMFCQTRPRYANAVASLTKRESRRIFRTNDKLTDVEWKIDENERLIPYYCCDRTYLESAFNNDQAFFLRLIGSVNSSQMKESLVNAPRQFLADSDFLVEVSEIAKRWFGNDISKLTQEQKAKVIPYIRRIRKTTISQLARVFGLPRDRIVEMIS